MFIYAFIVNKIAIIFDITLFEYVIVCFLSLINFVFLAVAGGEYIFKRKL